MMAQVTSVKIAAAASRAMARRVQQGGPASSLPVQLTPLERRLDHSLTISQSWSENSPSTETSNQTGTMKLQSQSKHHYHQQSLAEHATSEGTAVVGLDENSGHLLEGFCNGRCDQSHDKHTALTENEKAVTLDSKAIVNMLMLRKELLLLHKLLDTLH
jgi:hypothetical protein